MKKLEGNVFELEIGLDVSVEGFGISTEGFMKQEMRKVVGKEKCAKIEKLSNEIANIIANAIKEDISIELGKDPIGEEVFYMSEEEIEIYKGMSDFRKNLFNEMAIEDKKKVLKFEKVTKNKSSDEVLEMIINELRFKG